MGVPRQVLVKVVVSGLNRCSHLEVNDIPSFFPDSGSSILGLSTYVSFVSEFFWKAVEIGIKKKPVILRCPFHYFCCVIIMS